MLWGDVVLIIAENFGLPLFELAMEKYEMVCFNGAFLVDCSTNCVFSFGGRLPTGSDFIYKAT
jgi:hypothetical protein